MGATPSLWGGEGGPSLRVNSAIHFWSPFDFIDRPINFEEPSGTTILEGIKEVVKEDAEVIFEERYLGKSSADFAIIAVGERPYAGPEGDQGGARRPLRLDPEAEDLVLNVCGDLPCLLVLITGRPLHLTSLLPVVNSFVVAWLPGTEGGSGIAEMIFEGAPQDFSGILPITWFKSVEQLPMNFGDDSYDPLFPFGFGLMLNGTVLNATERMFMHHH